MRENLKKAIIFDCDNTLWKGILGEGNVEHNSDIQQDIVFMSNRGVIIGLCSKNNEQDVLDALKDQILTMDFISIYRINWNDKASNLKEIAEELNIGLDAILFVDDSDYERGLVTQYLPEVVSVHPQELMKAVNAYFDLSGDFSKTRQYKENLQRARVKEQFVNVTDYLDSLNMVISIKINDYSQIPRIAELTQKTNQFNLTTRRYDEMDIESFMDEHQVYSLSVKDKFGDNGVTGVCIVIGQKIDTFLLSCRILGRNVEYALLDYVIADQRDRGVITLIGEYISTPKNEQVRRFYNSVDFYTVNVKDGVVTFMGCTNIYNLQAPNYFSYE